MKGELGRYLVIPIFDEYGKKKGEESRNLRRRHLFKVFGLREASVMCLWQESLVIFDTQNYLTLVGVPTILAP